MSEDERTGTQHLIAAPTNSIGTTDLDLVTRGLLDSETVRVTGLDVTEAKASNPRYSSLSRQAVKIALEHGSYWSVRLMAQVMLDEVLTAEPLRRTVMAATVAPSDDGMAPAETVSWFKGELARVRSLLSDSDNLSGRIAEAANSPDQEFIIAVAREYGDTYGRVLRWCLDTTRACVRPAFTKFASDFAGMVRPAISEMGLFPSRVGSMVDNLLLSTDDDEEPVGLTCEMQLNMPESIMEGLQEVSIAEMFADNARMVMASPTFKICPQCQHPAVVEAAQCVRCGRLYQSTAPTRV